MFKQNFVIRFYVMVFTILLINNTINGQNKADSLRLAIPGSSKDLNRQAVLYAALSEALSKVNFDSSLFYAKKGLQLSEKAGYIEGIIKNCLQLGNLTTRRDSLDLAQKFYERAVVLINDKTDSIDLMAIWNGLAYVYDLRSDFSRALDGYMKGLEIAERTNNDLGKSYFYNNIAVIYDRTGSFRKGLGYYKRALLLFERRHDSVYYANALINIGLAYKNLEMIDSANYFFIRSLPIQQRLRNYYGITNLYNNLGELKFEAKEYDKALHYFLLSQQMISNLDSLFWGSRLYLNVQVAYDLGRTFQEMKEYGKAMNYFQEVKRNSGQASFLSFETDAIKGISEIFEKTGKSDSALKYARLHMVYSDSLKKTEDNERMAVIEFEYNYKKEKEREAFAQAKQEVLEKRKEMRLMLLIGGILTISIILLLLFLLQRSKIRRMNLLKSNLQLEKSNLMKDLSLKNRELASKVMSLIEKNELLAEMSERLKKIIPATDDSNSELLRSVVHDLQHQHSEGFWEEFNVHFKEINPDFYTRLSKEFSDLSPNEMKLCAFLKLNLSTKEISMITRKNEHSIKIARYRLRQKFGISREENLVMFLGRY